MPLMWRACIGTACLSEACPRRLWLWPWLALIQILPSSRLLGTVADSTMGLVN